MSMIIIRSIRCERVASSCSCKQQFVVNHRYTILLTYLLTHLLILLSYLITYLLTYLLSYLFTYVLNHLLI